MSNDSTTSAPWSGDVNQAAIDDWTDETTTFDRVTAVIDTTSTPAFASEIAERAAVAEPTARRHLTSLAAVGRVETIPVDGGTKYKRSPSTIALRRIAGLHAHYSKSGLEAAIDDIRGKLSALREEHGVGNASDLATELELGDDDWTDVARMRDIEENLQLAKAALNLYGFDPDAGERDAGGTADEGDSPSSTGALAGFGAQHTA
jgi:DNA-binding transcriptional ArsR family regulator